MFGPHENDSPGPAVALDGSGPICDGRKNRQTPQLDDSYKKFELMLSRRAKDYIAVPVRKLSSFISSHFDRRNSLLKCAPHK